MKITEISVKRPAAVIMVLVLLLGLGGLGYMNMGADLLPTMNIPVIAITTSYYGAGAEEIRKDIVKPIEDSISGITGIDEIQSTATEGIGQTTIQFTMETNMNTALMDVQKAIETASAKLPSDAQKPVIMKYDPGEQAVLTLSISGELTYDELYNQADTIKQRIEKINGVGKVSLIGGIKRQLMIEVDKTALEYYGINLNTLMGKIRSDNVNMPAGQIKEEKSLQTVKVIGEFENINDVKNLLIPIQGGENIRLEEIAKIGLQYPDKDQYLRLDGKSTIGITVQKQSDANVVDAVNKVKEELDKIQKSLPNKVKLVIASDTTTFIDSSLKGIRNNLIEGIITTALILFLFFRSWRSSLIVLVAIPTSLISTLFMMYACGFTLNMMSLMGLSLCVGILVDDSIVVLENIQRHLGYGKNPVTAAIEGRQEIGMAAIAITLCDVVVFAPVAFMSGMAGQMFKQFGLTVVFATLFSLLISFTITPMLASRLLKEHKEEKVRKGKSNDFAEKVVNAYSSFLEWSLNHRWKIVALIFAAFIGSVALIPAGFIGTEFVSQTDSSSFSIDIKLSPGSPLFVTDEKVKMVEEYLLNRSDVKSIYATVGNRSDKASANISVKLIDKSKRKAQSEIASEVRVWGKKLEGIDFNVSESLMGSSGASKPIQINVKGQDMDVLKEISAKVEDIVKSVDGTADVSNSSSNVENEIRVKIDKLAATEYGVSVSDITSVLRTAVQGSSTGVFREAGTQYDITVKYMDDQIKTEKDLGAIKLNSITGSQINLSQVATIYRADSQQSITRMGRQDVITISANIFGKTLGDINKEIESQTSLLASTIPDGYSIETGGTSKQMNEAFTPLIKAILASLILIYMILVVLYESFMSPLLRMLSLPCAFIGSFVLLAITGKTLNMMSMIGLIMLDGLASKNGTLLIDYTNTLMKRGYKLRDALMEAGVKRIRPIIMTSVTMIVGMIPSALSIGEGSEIKSSMSMVIVGGMITSTILTPILIPVAYTIIDDIKNFFARRKHSQKIVSEVIDQ